MPVKLFLHLILFGCALLLLAVNQVIFRFFLGVWLLFLLPFPFAFILLIFADELSQLVLLLELHRLKQYLWQLRQEMQDWPFVELLTKMKKFHHPIHLRQLVEVQALG